MFLARPSRTLAPLALALAAVATAIAIVPPGTLPALACMAAFLLNILLLVTAFVLVVVGGVVTLFVRSKEALAVALAGLALAVIPFALGALAARMGAPACFD